MRVYIERDGRHLELDKTCKGIELLKELNINSNTVLIVKNGEIMLDEDIINKDDEVKILSVVSGG